MTSEASNSTAPRRSRTAMGLNFCSEPVLKNDFLMGTASSRQSVNKNSLLLFICG